MEPLQVWETRRWVSSDVKRQQVDIEPPHYGSALFYYAQELSLMIVLHLT